MEKGRRSLRTLAVATLVLALGLMMVPETMAQRGARGMRAMSNPDWAMQRLTLQLNLSEQQASDIKPIMEEHFREQEAIQQQYSRGTPVFGTPEMAELRARTHERVEAHLNADQIETYRVLQQTPGAVRGGQRPYMRSGRRGGYWW